MKRSLNILVLLCLLVFAALAWLSLTQSGLAWLHRQALPYLPDQLQTGTPEGRLTGPIIFRDVRFQQKGHRLQADEILLDWHPGSLLAARIHISQLNIHGLAIELAASHQPQTGQDAAPLALPDIRLPWRLRLENMQVDGLSLRRQQHRIELQQIRLDASSLLSHVDIHALTVRGDKFSADVTGRIQPRGQYAHRLETRLQVELSSGEIVNARGLLRGSLKATTIKQQVTGALQMGFEGQLRNLLDKPGWQASVNARAFDAGRLLVDGPALRGRFRFEAEGDLETARLQGQLQFDYQNSGPIDGDLRLQRQADGQIQIQRVTLRANGQDAENPVLLDIAGNWQPGQQGGDVDLSLDWQHLRWPLKTDPWFNSAEGKARLQGNLAAYNIQLTTDRPWPQAPPSTWYAEAEGDPRGLTFRHLRIRALDGETRISGRLDWSPRLSWQADIQGHDLNPASLWPQWPGKLQARLSSQGGMQNGQLVAQGEIIELKGQLRDHSVSAEGHGRWQNQGLDIDRLTLQSGTSAIRVSGRVAEMLNIDWTLNSPSLAELYPRAQGQLSAAGTVSGPAKMPIIETRLNGQALELPDVDIGAVDAEVKLDLARWDSLRVRLTGQGLRMKNHSLQTLAISGNARHLSLTAATDADTLQLSLRGTPGDRRWQGHIETASLQSTRFGDWRLKAPAPLYISEQALQLDTLCWQSEPQANLCASLQGQQTDWQADLAMQQLPLALLSPWLPPELKLQGMVQGEARLNLRRPDRLTGDMTFTFPAGALSYPLLEGERDHWDYRGGELQVSLGEQGVKARSRFTMNNGDGFSLNLELPGANLMNLDIQQQKLSADARLDIQDLGLIEALLPEVQDLQGNFALKIAAGGTLGQPQINGRGHLDRGSLRIPRLGLTIEKLAFYADSNNLQQLNLRLEARSGDGQLTIQGTTRLQPENGWPTLIHIGGEQFEVSNIPEARLQVSPDLSVKLQHRRIEVTGNLHIPYARLQPKDITSAARASDDAVIIGSQQTAEEKWTVLTRVRLTLGDRVHFYGFGFEGRFGGSLLLEDEPGQLTRATGEINVPEGRYRAYGQRLDVEYGRLLYTGGPLTNPGLDLRAVRHVGNVTAGIKLQGTLNQPQLELFSDPAMGETDALSYLVLDRPIENTSEEKGAAVAKAALALGLSGGDRLARLLGDRFGLDEMRVESSETGDQASLVVGRYLSPKIYVSYGVGLIEAINTFTVRYQISRRWQLKAESGEAQGADFLYTIER